MNKMNIFVNKIQDSISEFEYFQAVTILNGIIVILVFHFSFNI